jgi:branched-chain amino acid transport system permease protein
MIDIVVSILFDGLAYAMLLFVISVGLSVTMGLMGFVNLAHGAFAMAGGYAVTSLMGGAGLPYPAALIGAAVIVGVASIPVERLLYARVYAARELDQVMLTIGLVFMAIAAFTFFYGPSPQQVQLPDWLRGQIDLGFRSFPAFRFMVILIGVALILALWLGFERTGFGARIRAAVDNRTMAQVVGIDVDRLFMVTFAVGSGLAALGGGVAIEMLGVSPIFAAQYLVYFLIVVAVGGLGSVKGAFFAALVLGIVDNAGKYLWPEGGAFFIYALTLVLLLARPQGLFGRG